MAKQRSRFGCKLLCDEELAAIAEALEMSLSPREKDLARHILAGVEVRQLPKLLDGRPTARTVREGLRRLYQKAGVRRREQFTALCFDAYRAWRSTDPPSPCR